MLTSLPGPDRAFLTRTYPTMKKHNPTIPIMLREAQGTLPKVYARYDFGKEKSQSLEGMVIRSYVSVSGYAVELGQVLRIRGGTGDAIVLGLVTMG